MKKKEEKRREWSCAKWTNKSQNKKGKRQKNEFRFSLRNEILVSHLVVVFKIIRLGRLLFVCAAVSDVSLVIIAADCIGHEGKVVLLGFIKVNRSIIYE